MYTDQRKNARGSGNQQSGNRATGRVKEECFLPEVKTVQNRGGARPREPNLAPRPKTAGPVGRTKETNSLVVPKMPDNRSGGRKKEEDLFLSSAGVGRMTDTRMRREYTKALGFINKCHQHVNTTILKTNPRRQNLFLLPDITNYSTMFIPLIDQTKYVENHEPPESFGDFPNDTLAEGDTQNQDAEEEQTEELNISETLDPSALMEIRSLVTLQMNNFFATLKGNILQNMTLRPIGKSGEDKAINVPEEREVDDNPLEVDFSVPSFIRDQGDEDFSSVREQSVDYIMSESGTSLQVEPASDDCDDFSDDHRSDGGPVSYESESEDDRSITTSGESSMAPPAPPFFPPATKKPTKTATKRHVNKKCKLPSLPSELSFLDDIE